MTYMMAAARQGFESALQAYIVVGPYLHQLCIVTMLVCPRNSLYRYSSSRYRDRNSDINGHLHV
ncbi:hypothetical protein BJX62DRAFT_116498 [Aspergillus germanicus]